MKQDSLRKVFWLKYTTHMVLNSNAAPSPNKEVKIIYRLNQFVIFFSIVYSKERTESKEKCEICFLLQQYI